VTPRPGQGTFVERALGEAPLAAHAALRRELNRCVRAARAAGLQTEDIEAVFSSVLHQDAQRGVA